MIGIERVEKLDFIKRLDSEEEQESFDLMLEIGESWLTVEIESDRVVWFVWMRRADCSRHLLYDAYFFIDDW